MYDNGAEGSFPISYRGFYVDDASRLTRNEFKIALGDSDKTGRERLYSVVRELVRNAEKHGLQDASPPQFEVNADETGTYVEVISFGRPGDVARLEQAIRHHAFASDIALHAEELDTIERNYRKKSEAGAEATDETIQSGIGILQVMRRSKRIEGKRAVEVWTTPVGHYLKVRVRAYVI